MNRFDVPGEIWKPAADEPDLEYCTWLMHHAALKSRSDFDEFMFELAKNRKLFQSVFLMVYQFMQDHGCRLPSVQK